MFADIYKLYGSFSYLNFSWKYETRLVSSCKNYTNLNTNRWMKDIPGFEEETTTERFFLDFEQQQFHALRN